jgi:subtilisin family serine protease
MRIQNSRRRTLAARGGVLLAATAVVIAQAPQVDAATAGSSSTYIVLYDNGASSSGAASAVAAAGGTLVANYPQIGVVVARSAATDFATKVATARGVAGASRSEGLATRLDTGQLDSGTSSTDIASPTASDPLSGLQWDMDQIQAPAAHALNNGAGILVGDIDTGLDYTHPDLAPNVDDAASANCVSGAPVPGKVAAMDDNGHGTHTAGTIAAAANGLGMVGVAPQVRIAGIKAGNADGFFFPEAVICAFMWAGTHGIDVTSNSYFADPWLFNCKNDPTQDQTSPDDTTPVTRDITNACATVPVEVPGVIGVTATGNKEMKSFYSSFGISTTDVAAPGGDSVLQLTAAAPNGRVLSTWPASLIGGCARKVFDGAATYCYLQGTSMATPHVAGVAALLASAKGLTGGALEAALERGSTPLTCPSDTSAYDFFPAVDGGQLQTCEGGTGHNSWFGAGEVNALNAVR